jgi:release factor glutamine methyltransferase
MGSLSFSNEARSCLSIKKLLHEGRELLAQASITSPDFEARILLGFVIGHSLEYMLSHSSDNVSTKLAKKFFSLIERRCKHEPIAYIVGKKEFYGVEFKVNKHVLIPRPDTETLVELAIQCMASPQVSSISILDLGTGSGCLLLSLLKIFPLSSGLGVDIQARSLAVATQNAKRLKLSKRAKFSNKNWQNLQLKKKFDLIVSNPPYIRTHGISELEADVKTYEPVCALDGGYDGLVCYRSLMPIIRKLLKPNGISILECGYDQLHSIVEIATENGLTLTKHMKDYSGTVRAIALNIRT